MLVMERIRMLIECEERLRRAARIRAGKLGKKNVSDVIVPILERELADELKQADEAIAEESEPEKKPKRK